MAANNAEELRRLESIRLNETLRLFDTNNEKSRVTASVAPAPGNVDNVTARLDALNLEANQLALTKAFAVALGAQKQRGKTLTLTEKADPVQTSNLDYFQIDMAQETVAGMIGTEYLPNTAEQRRFYSFPFKSESIKQQCLKDLVMFAYMQSLKSPTNAEARAAFVDAADDRTAVDRLNARKRRQQAALITYMGQLNTMKTIEDHQENMSMEIKNSMMRNTTLTTAGGKNMIGAPVLGNQSYAEPETLRNLNTIISNTPFGSPHNSKPLSFFLQTVAGVINGVYNDKAGYQILLNVLSGSPHQLIQQNEQQQVSFTNAWMDLQITYNSYGQSTEGVMGMIKNCLRTRPQDITSSIGYLRQLFWKKNQFKDPSERDFITNSETKDSIFSLISIWYPSYLPVIRSRFEELTSHARSHGYTALPAPQMLTMLAAEYIKNAQALPQKNAEVNAMAVDFGVDDLSEEAMTFDTNRSLARGPEINAFHQNRRGYDQQNKPRMIVPDHLKDKCLKCASPQHWARDCPKYPNEPIGATVCVYCNGKHSSKCKNLSINELRALPSPEEAEISYPPEAYAGYHGSHEA